MTRGDSSVALSPACCFRRHAQPIFPSRHASCISPKGSSRSRGHVRSRSRGTRQVRSPDPESPMLATTDYRSLGIKVLAQASGGVSVSAQIVASVSAWELLLV